jgi:CelD/BcsL family acetyltransferase involved in cellulose biosynthesis
MLGAADVAILSTLEMDQRHAECWDRFRRSSTEYQSPFYSRSFLHAVAESRPQVRVLVGYQQGKPVGFLPYEPDSNGIIQPFANAFNDSHGILCHPNEPVDYDQLVTAAGFRGYRFHALTGCGQGFSKSVIGWRKSYLANLRKYDCPRYSEGYVSYLEQTRGTIFKQRRKTKKMIRDLGTLRLEFDDRNEDAFQKTIELKRQQYQRTNIFDILSVQWARDVMRRLWGFRESENTDSCQGVLSTLYAGDTLVASHFGMREGRLLHYWFPVYDNAFHQYSPGTALFLEIVRQRDALGIDTIDMGYGEQPYKSKLTETVSMVPYGITTSSWSAASVERFRFRSEHWIKKIPFKECVKSIVRKVHPKLGQGRYQ